MSRYTKIQFTGTLYTYRIIIHQSVALFSYPLRLRIGHTHVSREYSAKCQHTTDKHADRIQPLPRYSKIQATGTLYTHRIIIHIQQHYSRIHYASTATIRTSRADIMLSAGTLQINVLIGYNLCLVTQKYKPQVHSIHIESSSLVSSTILVSITPPHQQYARLAQINC